MYTVFSVKELYLNIVKDFSPRELNDLSLIDKTICSFFDKFGRDIIRSSLYGANKYAKIFKVKIEEPELPENIYRIYNSIYRFSLENNVTQKPIVYLIDPQLKLEKTGQLMQPYFKDKSGITLDEKKQDGYRWFDKVFHNRCDKGYSPYPHYENPRFIAYSKPYWGILINGIIFQGKNYSDQKRLIGKVKINGKPLRLPNVEEASIGIFLHWGVARQCEFSKINQTRTADVVLTPKRPVVTIDGLDYEGLGIKQEKGDNEWLSRGVSPFFTL